MAPYVTQGSLTTDSREVAISETWETQTDWEGATETVNVEIVDGTIQLSEGAIVPEDGVARYEFEQSVTDSWGSYDGGDNTSAGYATGTVGSYAKDFDGVDDYVNIPNDILDYSSTDFSVSAWVYHDELGADQRVWTIDQDSSITLRYDVGNDEYQFGYYVMGTGNIVATYSAPPSIETWYHVIGVFDLTNSEMRFYWNGTHQGTASTSDIGSAQSATGPDNIGSAHASGQWFNGRIDDPRLYSRALTDSEASNLYNTGSIT